MSVALGPARRWQPEPEAARAQAAHGVARCGKREAGAQAGRGLTPVRAAPRYEDDRPDEEFTAGQTYFVGPGHIPKILGDKTCIMVEFAESANKIYENIDKSD